jgi:FPC/CPF motif-containing protein YcgG
MGLAELTETTLADDLPARFEAFIRDRAFPCVGAKSALSRGQLRVIRARDLTSSWNDAEIYSELYAFAARYRADTRLFQSFAVVFDGPSRLGETEFEHHLWRRVQSLTDKDGWQGVAADPRVDSTPESPHFSLSFGGEAFFVVGLHPNASRPARRFEAPALVFNLHDQFERLRAEGGYDKLRSAILDRDEALAGSINPMLAPFGSISEARQYSGREVGSDWVCPFRPRATPADSANDDEIDRLEPTG